MKLIKCLAQVLALIFFMLLSTSCTEAPENKNQSTNTHQPEKIATTQEKPIKKKSSNINSCAAMSEKSCLLSKECILEQHKEKGYYCRESQNFCEVGFIQKSNSAKSTCTNNKGCKFKNASCFCPSGVTCVCGGGAPSACIPD